MVGVLEVHRYYTIATPAHTYHSWTPRNCHTSTRHTLSACLSKFAIWPARPVHPVFWLIFFRKGPMPTHTHTPQNYLFPAGPNPITAGSVNYTQWCCCSAKHVVAQQNTTLTRPVVRTRNSPCAADWTAYPTLQNMITVTTSGHTKVKKCQITSEKNGQAC